MQLQGPLCGSSTVSASLIQYLVGLPTKTDVYFCGVDSGFANIFSLLEHFKVILLLSHNLYLHKPEFSNTYVFFVV